MKERSLWMRLGILLSGSKEEIEKVLSGDKETLLELIKRGKFTTRGDTYIPDEEVEWYNEINGTNFKAKENAPGGLIAFNL